MLYFVLLAYLFGPVAAIPYGLYNLGLDPVSIYVYLSLVYVLPVPMIFWFFEFAGSYRKFYSLSFFRKFAKVTKRSVKDVLSVGDELQEEFEQRLGHLGFYLAISVFTFLFGIFWASLFAYVLKVKKARAILSIAAGVLVGDAFWLLVTLEMLPLKTPLEVLSILVLISLVIYGRKREAEVIRWVESRLRKQQA